RLQGFLRLGQLLLEDPVLTVVRLAQGDHLLAQPVDRGGTERRVGRRGVVGHANSSGWGSGGRSSVHGSVGCRASRSSSAATAGAPRGTSGSGPAARTSRGSGTSAAGAYSARGRSTSSGCQVGPAAP